jgi:hypothetical protein
MLRQRLTEHSAAGGQWSPGGTSWRRRRFCSPFVYVWHPRVPVRETRGPPLAIAWKAVRAAPQCRLNGEIHSAGVESAVGIFSSVEPFLPLPAGHANLGPAPSVLVLAGRACWLRLLRLDGRISSVEHVFFISPFSERPSVMRHTIESRVRRIGDSSGCLGSKIYRMLTGWAG